VPLGCWTYLINVTFVHTHCFKEPFFPGECVLTGCLFDFSYPFIPELCILWGQAEALHTLLGTGVTFVSAFCRYFVPAELIRKVYYSAALLDLLYGLFRLLHNEASS